MAMLKGLWRLMVVLCLCAGLAGCETTASPDTSETIYMELGDTQVFKVEVPGGRFYHAWYVYHGHDLFEVVMIWYGRSSSFRYKADSESLSNRIRLGCEVYETEFPFTVRERLEWRIEIPQTPPLWSGDYHIWDQADIDYLEENGYEEIDGSLYFETETMETLEGLDGITAVRGDLNFQTISFHSIRNFNGLNGLGVVGGDVYLSNSDMETINGLNGLATIEGDLTIDDCYSLKSIDGLASLKTVGGTVSLYNNDDLFQISGLNHITTVGDSLSVHYNSALTSLGNFETVTSIGNRLDIGGNNALTTLGLNSLTSVAGIFQIYDNPELCTSLAEELRDQVEAADGIGGTASIARNKDCQ